MPQMPSNIMTLLPKAIATVPLAPQGELDGSGGDPSDECPSELPKMEAMPMSAPKNAAPELRQSEQSNRTNHDYHRLANPDARKLGAQHKEALLAKLNKEAFTATIFHML